VIYEFRYTGSAFVLPCPTMFCSLLATPLPTWEVALALVATVVRNYEIGTHDRRYDLGVAVSGDLSLRLRYG